jgi:hypothetical protein
MNKLLNDCIKVEVPADYALPKTWERTGVEVMASCWFGFNLDAAERFR